MSKLSTMRKVLDRVYLASGVVACLFLIAILSLIVLQMLARWTGEVFPGAPDYAGYCMAAAYWYGAGLVFCLVRGEDGVLVLEV